MHCAMRFTTILKYNTHLFLRCHFMCRVNAIFLHNYLNSIFEGAVHIVQSTILEPVLKGWSAVDQIQLEFRESHHGESCCAYSRKGNPW